MILDYKTKLNLVKIRLNIIPIAIPAGALTMYALSIKNLLQCLFDFRSDQANLDETGTVEKDMLPSNNMTCPNVIYEKRKTKFKNY